METRARLVVGKNPPPHYNTNYSMKCHIITTTTRRRPPHHQFHCLSLFRRLGYVLPMSIPTMAHQPYMSHSPPPLQHPKPTHIAYPPPEPPHTPAQSTDSSPYSQPQRISQDGYLRYSSPPAGETLASSSGFSSYAPPLAQGQQSAQPRQPYGQGGTPGVQGVHGYAAPGYAWPGMNDATAQMGMQFGKSAVAAGQEYVEKNVGIISRPSSSL